MTYEYKPFRFFFLVYALTWTPWLVAAYLSHRSGMELATTLLNLAGLIGTVVATLLFIFGSKNELLKKDFLDRLLNLRRISPLYLLATVLIMPGVTYLAILLSVQLGRSSDQLQIVPGLLAWLPILLLAPTLEEFAWRGYAADSLRARFGMLNSALLFSVLWAIWHVPLIFIKGTYQYSLTQMPVIYLANFFVSIIPAAIIATWLYYKHRRSIIAGILFHFVLNTVAICFAIDQFTKCIITAAFAVLALLIIVFDRKAFSEGSRNFLEDGRSTAT